MSSLNANMIPQELQNKMAFGAALSFVLLGIVVFIICEIKYPAFLEMTGRVVKPLANISISVGILTFVIGAYQRSLKDQRERKLEILSLSERGWLNVEKMFIANPDLANLYNELFLGNRSGVLYPPSEIDSGLDDLEQRRIRRKEYHVISYLTQVMEDVYNIADLERAYQNVEMEGWMNTFRMWVSSPKFSRAWDSIKYLYGRRFRSWVDTILF